MTLVMPKFLRLFRNGNTIYRDKEMDSVCGDRPNIFDAYTLAIIATASPRSSSLDCHLVLVITALCALLGSV